MGMRSYSLNGYGIKMSDLDVNDHIDYDLVKKEFGMYDWTGVFEKMTEDDKLQGLVTGHSDDDEDYLYIPSALPWQFHGDEKDLTEEKVAHIIYDILKPYLKEDVTPENIQELCDGVDDSFYG